MSRNRHAAREQSGAGDETPDGAGATGFGVQAQENGRGPRL